MRNLPYLIGATALIFGVGVIACAGSIFARLGHENAKMRVIQMRGRRRDYVDIRALVSDGIDLSAALGAAKAIDRSFEPATSIRRCSSTEERWTGSQPPYSTI
jgi:hypothetical protein